MELKSYKHLEVLTWTAVIIAALSMIATPALSQESREPAALPNFRACLQSDGSRCLLVARTIGIMIGVADGDALISYLVPSPQGFAVDHKDSVNKDMEEQVLAGTMTDEDAAFAYAELLASHDLQYKIPQDVSALKSAVGFTPQAVLSPQDQVDVIASHLQMMLGVSAVTADYLVAKLGLEITADQPTDQPAEESRAQDALAPVQIVIQTANSISNRN